MTLFPEWQAEHGGEQIPQRLKVMHGVYGVTPGHICGDCVHFQRYRQSVTWFKCDLTQKGGAATDWRKSWLACGKFEQAQPAPVEPKLIKAISLTQPWASLIVLGLKVTETRSWSTKYRGSLAIHAAKGLSTVALRTGYTEPFRSQLKEAGYPIVTAMPRGVIIAICKLVECVPTEKYQGRDTLDNAFGDFSPGRFAWKLEDVEPLETPIEIKGALGLWSWRRPD